MTNTDNLYKLTEIRSEKAIKYFFISKGENNIIKAVQYSFVQKLNNRDVFNLGFGDYAILNDTIIDHISTNNGDAYKVFNTVLSTIPEFFKVYKNDILMVQGSDGQPDFLEQCKLICTKKCVNECKNFNRRINIYKRYIDKNYEKLKIDYLFYGGFKNINNQTFMEKYKPGEEYDIVFLLKNVPNFKL